MMPSRSILPLALAALTLAGCGGSSPPPPSLSSNNPSERIEAVRHAQAKYGARKRSEPDVAAESLALATDKAAIVGRWNHPLADAAYYRFNADGTVTRGALLKSVEGTY